MSHALEEAKKSSKAGLTNDILDEFHQIYHDDLDYFVGSSPQKCMANFVRNIFSLILDKMHIRKKGLFPIQQCQCPPRLTICRRSFSIVIS